MDKLYKLEFTEQELNIVLGGLSELPFKVSNEVINKIFTDIKPQQQQEVKE